MTHTPTPWTQFGDEIYGADGTRIAEAVTMRDVSLFMSSPELLKTLQHIASIAHDGGLAGLSEHAALIAIRRLTMKHWQTDGNTTEHERRARDALRASLP